MSDWRIIWFDGTQLRETIILSSDIYNIVNIAASQGVNSWAILKIERVPKP